MPNISLQELEYENKIAFRILSGDQVREVTVEAMRAFGILEGVLRTHSEFRRGCHITLVGNLGQDVDKIFTTPYDFQKSVKAIFRLWRTQAVQARAALLRQKIELVS